MLSATDSLTYETLTLPPGDLFFTQHRVKESGVTAQEPFDHFHDMLEVIFFDQAGGEVEIEGQRHRLANQQILILPALYRHNFFIESQPRLDLHMLQIESPVLATFRHELELVTLSGFVLVQPEENMYQRLRSLLVWLHEIRNNEIAALRDDVLRLLMRGLSSLAGHDPSAAPQHKGHGPGTFTPLLNTLNLCNSDNFREPPLAEAARLCHLSKFYFSRTFTRTFGMGYKEYLTRRRISKAVSLLSLGNLSVTQVALSCGFSDTAHLCRLLRGRLRMRPLELRRKTRTFDKT